MGSGTELASAARKRATLAEQLQADQIVLATAAPRWAESTVEAMCRALRAHRWSRVVPRLRLISGPGTDEIVDLSADADTAQTSKWR
jgi:cell division inhibitor SulA